MCSYVYANNNYDCVLVCMLWVCMDVCACAYVCICVCSVSFCVYACVYNYQTWVQIHSIVFKYNYKYYKIFKYKYNCNYFGQDSN